MHKAVPEAIRLIGDDGWRLLRIRGSHRQYRHPANTSKDQ
ncbi:MAG: type II toxin-antitoxin system HicA family toxin [Gammaproteobacteria bacterium]|nr:type II toxin-antitoxin system HicA family toxin [Gammaproteobacteria bacterium]